MTNIINTTNQTVFTKVGDYKKWKSEADISVGIYGMNRFFDDLSTEHVIGRPGGAETVMEEEVKNDLYNALDYICSPGYEHLKPLITHVIFVGRHADIDERGGKSIEAVFSFGLLFPEGGDRHYFHLRVQNDYDEDGNEEPSLIWIK